jgi:hypothetical protein
MSCCATHDRMDLVLSIDEYHDAPCGTPTSPRGEPRFCCRQCPARTQPLAVKAVWASNPVLLGFLTADERAQVIALAISAGPLHVDIVGGVPLPAANAEPERGQA